MFRGAFPAPPREPEGMASSVAWECWDRDIVPVASRCCFLSLQLTSSHYFVSPVVAWVSAALGRGFSRLRAPPSVSLGSTPGCCSLAIALEPRQGSHMVLGQHVGKCESDRDTGQHCQAKSMLCWGSSPGDSLRLYF